MHQRNEALDDAFEQAACDGWETTLLGRETMYSDENVHAGCDLCPCRQINDRQPYECETHNSECDLHYYLPLRVSEETAL